VTIYEYILFPLIMLAGTGGELCMARAMKSLGETKDFSPSGIARVVWRAARLGWMWLAILLMATGFFSLLGMLSIANVSFVVPVTAFSYVLGTLGGKLFLGEQVTQRRWIGVLLVCTGVSLVFLGKH
jgi:drug/metabolite transporter (DMT)-like permease